VNTVRSYVEYPIIGSDWVEIEPGNTGVNPRKLLKPILCLGSPNKTLYIRAKRLFAKK